MPIRYLWKLMLGLVVVFIIGGCSTNADGNSNANNGAAGSEGPTISIRVGDNELLVKPSDRSLSGSYRNGITIMELLKGSNIATFAEDNSSILSVKDFSLESGMIWELQMDGLIMGNADWNNTVGYDSQLVFTAKPKDHQEPLQTVMMTLNGGSVEVDLHHSYIMLFKEDLTVRDLLKSCGMVQLDDGSRNVLSVNDYTPLSNEVWKLKVNGKQLLDNGMDMKLMPHDVLEIVLTLR
ncbi:hypothetical protein [Paenibacillus etheri]|uniref:DUF4430 domain-containing protein n=1 Tax=Paenibacillus etheri TaxID=1306852 RepID=A0A0W1B076_9BACL|nr:hypothetical protein [Paenibacillus etheri]KTD86968.1 hypothetical protein UQ64_08955 [Paenibacillus etheri]